MAEPINIELQVIGAAQAAAAVQARGGRYVDAPMTRTPQPAEDGCVGGGLGDGADRTVERDRVQPQTAGGKAGPGACETKSGRG